MNFPEHYHQIYSCSLFKFVRIGNTYNIILNPINPIDPIITIGPDYVPMLATSIVALIIFSIVHWILCILYSETNYNLIIGWRCIFALLIISFTLTALSNPGINVRNTKLIKDPLTKGYCIICKVDRAEHTKHCDRCEACIHNYDHHCLLTSKCMGKRINIYFYMTFVSTTLLYLYTVISIVAFFVKDYLNDKTYYNSVLSKLKGIFNK